MHDVIVIGAGLGGLTTAALLARAGRDVLLLEAHGVPGGCASYFVERKFLLDVGATTLSGFRTAQPVTTLLSRLDIELPRHRCDPGMIVHTPGARISRWTDHERWISECERAFGVPGYGTSRKAVLHIGIPRTFIRYTGRHRGWVGGIPHSTLRPIKSWQGHRTRIPGLHLVGDTVYPGQGAPAMVLGAMNLADDVLESV